MSKQMINGDEVEVKVFAPDGTMEASAALTERELATLQGRQMRLSRPTLSSRLPIRVQSSRGRSPCGAWMSIGGTLLPPLPLCLWRYGVLGTCEP